MRLSTARDRDADHAVAVIHAALDAGATLLDTANVYCWDGNEIGHNERLIAGALARWSGDRSRIEIATKGGLWRPKGAWVSDAKAKSLRAACEGSLLALGVAAIDLYQLHAVDPKTPFETSVRALAALQHEGMIRRIGLCNVTVNQIKTARAIADIASVQVSVSVLDDDNLRNGVAEYCREQGIRVLAYRPLGGADRAASLRRDPALSAIAAEHGVTAQDVALAWLVDLGVVPLPGCTRLETARSLAHVLRVRLSADNRRIMDERFSGRLLRIPRSARRAKPAAAGDVVIVMGAPGAGKSAVAQEFVAQGYERLNRDERGGTLTNLVSELAQGLAAGRKRWVLDNTYPTRKTRNAVIECAWQYGVPARCVHLTTSTADAQINAITRLIELHGRLPSPEELRDLGKMDPRYFGPDAQFRYERSLEPPDEDEGFESLERRAFERRVPEGWSARAVFLEYDDVLVRNTRGESPALYAHETALSSGARDALQQLREAGWLLFAQAWRPQIARGEITVEVVEQSFERARELLGLDITLSHCAHDAGPPICWCRKPLPGRILEFALPRQVALARSLLVGRGAADSTLAQRLGVPYTDDLRAVITTA